MKISDSFKSAIVEAICLLYILLFVYASVSKIIDFENFQVQLGQSPLLSAFAVPVSLGIPILELIIAFILLFPKFRYIGLMSSFGLMVMFTAYIFIMLYFSPFIPCSCGGILEKMSWNMHLVFNILLLMMAVCALLFFDKKSFFLRTKQFTVRLLLCTMISSVLIIILIFTFSEKIIHNENPFLRRYPPHPAEFSNAVRLKFNSYYLSGFADGRIYLGNYTTPAQIISFNSNLKDRKVHKIIFDPANTRFKVISWYVKGNYFYLLDGSIHKIFRGDIKTWKIDTELKDFPFFTRAIPIDSTTLVFRTNKGKKMTNTIGKFTNEQQVKVKYFEGLLQAQNEGVFDTDGVLMYSEELNKIVYLYYYRNGFVVADKNGKVENRGNTIDTIKHVNLKVSVLKNGTEYAISSPSITVNSSSTVYKNILFVRSQVKGRLENDQLWEKSFIIDVYDFRKNIYLYSFPIYHSSPAKKFSSFLATRTHIYALLGSDLVVYEIKNDLKKEMNSK
ncbi:MauE/DoxX family redox-associated membrane protein [Flavobacterium defluvii]|uniref:Methylamine utilisation protein MauE n=1 Tax=Flavobacterium defluvii TaxID=370979 RepID=A0A1M5JC78_9FLAO|nr:MauE/DoxX family redox-associated membrane protein [Flavobacterium defluvii]SHG38206.1 Methylamine utilisation protein MauE [Flavobacterium defluvii]